MADTNMMNYSTILNLFESIDSSVHERASRYFTQKELENLGQDSLIEALEQEDQKEVVKNEEPPDPYLQRVERIKKKAAAVSAVAGLQRSKNQLSKAKMDRDAIKAEASKDEPIYPREPEPEQQNDQDATQQSREAIMDYDLEVNLDSGNPMLETVLPSVMEAEADEDTEEETRKPQTKDEAEIEKIQAETDKLKAEAQAGGEMGGDPYAAGGAEGDPSMSGDPNVMAGMGGDNDDPMKGFGDATAPVDPMTGMMGGGIDPMTGATDDSPQKTSSALGRLYQLKKTYYRLSLLDKILKNIPDAEMQPLAKIVDEAFEVFRLIISNLKSYKTQIDDIIIGYFHLIKDVSKEIEDHLKSKVL